jgi:hypothetical protein
MNYVRYCNIFVIYNSVTCTVHITWHNSLYDECLASYKRVANVLQTRASFNIRCGVAGAVGWKPKQINQAILLATPENISRGAMLARAHRPTLR